MNPLVVVTVGVASLALLAGIIATWVAARGQRWRWGRTMESGPAVGEGVYRGALVSIERPRRVPAICALASVTAFAWGALTVCLFAPAGGLFFYVATFSIIPDRWWFALGVLGLLVAVIRGYMVGPRLVRMVRALAVRTPDSAGSVGSVARQSLFHHVLVAAALGVLCSGAGADPIAYACAIPCAIGAAQAALLLGARATLARLDREDAATSELA